MIGDALVWANLPKGVAKIIASCEVTAFCTKGVTELFGMNDVWFPYAADERARHVCLAPTCATPMCVSECAETAKCAGKIQVEQVLDGIEEVTK